ncbi:MAG: starvation-inducible DNA-binding protein [Chlamydiales bacterium]|jgi:starvation-inducible DNA-binding protein
MSVNTVFKESYVQVATPRLFQVLADAHVLYVMTLNCHWNVEGPSFGILHNLFKGQYEIISQNVDDLAERIRTLGEKVNGNLAAFLDQATLKEISSGLNADDMLRVLNESHERFIANLREHISFYESNNDAGTVDLLTSQLRYHEKTAWILRSHLAG